MASGRSLGGLFMGFRWGLNLEVMNTPVRDHDGSVRSVAFDPGDIEATVVQLRKAGFEPKDPSQVNSMGHHFYNGKPVEASWRLSGLQTSLPGISSFLCQYISPPHLGRTSPDSPSGSSRLK